MIESGDIQVIIEDGNNANLTQQIAYIKAGKTEIEEAVQEGIGDFDTNATAKTNAFNNNASAKTLSFNQNADAKTAIYDNNASEKLSAYNENATNKLAAYNANDTAKTEAYNLNATNKTTAFNTNASEKTSTFNDNAVAKTSGFNSNATSKTNDFNSNASDKTTAFNDNYTAKKALIDAEVQTAKDWATKTDGTVDGVDYSAKYYAQSILPIKDDITAVADITTDISAVAEDSSNIQTVVNNMTAINNAPTYANNSKKWAEGLDGEVAPLGGTHSSKGWAEIAEQAASGVQNPANRDLSNLTNTGQMIIDSVNGTISNCILEIPQNIKVTLENNVLTLNAGSVLTRTGSTYATVTTTQDISRDISNIDNGIYPIFVSGSPLGISSPVDITRVVSGDTTPADGDNTYYRFYNATDKLIYYNNGSSWNSTSLPYYPVCFIKMENGVVSFVKDSYGNDIIFNGAGFIGHHAFVYPNVKALVCRGYKEDGTLDSLLFNNQSLQIIELRNPSHTPDWYYPIQLNAGGNISRNAYRHIKTKEELLQQSALIQYVESDNVCYLWNGSSYGTQNWCPFVDYNYNGTTVTDFTIRQPYEGARNLLTDDIEEEVATKQTDVTTLTGYDATQTQTLKNINGVLTWVTD